MKSWMVGHDLVTAISSYNDPRDGSPPTPVYVGSTQITNERPMIPITHTITDISEQTDGFTLESHGFQYLNHASAVEGLLDDQNIRINYYPECEKLLQQIWRSITTVLTSPLALADATTVPDADLDPASIIHTGTGRRQESWTVRPHPAHRWYYKYRQRPDEVVLINCFDSDETAPARRAVHCAVEDADTQGQGDWESVEDGCT